jgi:hypothetical protein
VNQNHTKSLTQFSGKQDWTRSQSDTGLGRERRPTAAQSNDQNEELPGREIESSETQTAAAFGLRPGDNGRLKREPKSQGTDWPREGRIKMGKHHTKLAASDGQSVAGRSGSINRGERILPRNERERGRNESDRRTERGSPSEKHELSDALDKLDSGIENGAQQRRLGSEEIGCAQNKSRMMRSASGEQATSEKNKNENEA